MGYINVFISSPCSLCVKNRQLVVQGDNPAKFALEDINCVMIETRECTVSAYALQALAESGAVTFVCDGFHMPSGILMPYKNYFRQLRTLKLQLNASKPLMKRLWQNIVIAKIKNQALCCALASAESGEILQLSKKVLSGDSGNAEAVAAAIYFKTLFGKKFSRKDENDVTNSMLNYGYAIVRGLIARTIAAYGFEGSLGIHHCNEFNPFNLADDLIEPFRPTVDSIVYDMINGGETEMTTGVKRNLFKVVATDVLVNGQTCALSYAVEQVTQSLIRCLKEDGTDLCLPQFLPPSIHRYE